MAALSLVLALPALIPYVVPWVAARYGVDVAIERASYALPGPELRLQGLRIGPAAQALQARDVRVALDGRALLAGDLELAGLALEGARFNVVPVPQEQHPGPWQLFGLRPVLPAGLALPAPAALELRDVGLTFAEGGVPDLELDFLSLAPAPGGNRLLEATARTAGGEVRVAGSLTGPGVAGGELRVRLERGDLEALAGLLSPVLPGVREGRVGGDLKAGWSSGREPLTLEGTLDFVQVAADLAGSRVADATGRWEGKVRLARGDGGVTGVRVVGRLSLDRGALSTSAGTFEAEGLLFDGRTGWEMSAGEPGEWTLDGDGEVEHAAVREGPWAGVRARQTAFWGLWRGPGRELSVGQLRAARVDLPTVRGEAVPVQGPSLGEDGLSLDEVTAGPVTVPGPDDARPARAESVEATPAQDSGVGTAWVARGLRLLAVDQGRAPVDLTFGSGARLEQVLADALAAALESAYGAAGLTRAQAVQLLQEGAVPLARLELAAEGEPAGTGAARLESLAALLRGHPGAHLEVCGPEPEVEPVRDLLERAGRVPVTQLETCADVPAGEQAPGLPGVGLTLRAAP